MRLIDADELSRRMYTEAFVKDTDMQKWDSGCWIRYKLFENVLKEQPAIEERKAGWWIDRQLIYSDLHVATCSNCKMRVAVGKYCPNCGSDNREEGDRE